MNSKPKKAGNSWRGYEQRKQQMLQAQAEQRKAIPPDEYQRAIQKLAERLQL